MFCLSGFFTITVSAEFEFVMIIFTEHLAKIRATFYTKISSFSSFDLKIQFILIINTKQFITKFKVVLS